MTFINSTILITGGSSGLGLEMAGRFLEMGNQVIICSRTSQKLEEAKYKLPNVITYQCDISKPAECKRLSEWIKELYPQLNVLINNAAIVHQTPFFETEGILPMLDAEVETNFLAPVRLIKLIYPILKENKPMIINITTGLIYAPKAAYSFYNATKTALHSFTQTIRIQLKDTQTRVVEVMFPAVKTPWHKGTPPKIAISVEKAVDEMIIGLKKDKKEIRIGGSRLLYFVSRIAPKFAIKKVNSLK
ncbi:SDR family oxidoreductase [Aquimarina aquimarini]|uniref:SDR family oxidoreductase n=1 Tax=Aquimarina aquimarini TaxID=1191734 RepID=UPI000D54ED63|nr:SDR family NAD(P)-dependent oxidoreductase [Aquimarina aquimarini]